MMPLLFSWRERVKKGTGDEMGNRECHVGDPDDVAAALNVILQLLLLLPRHLMNILHIQGITTRLGPLWKLATL